MPENSHNLGVEQDRGVSGDDRYLRALLPFHDRKPWIVDFFNRVKEYFYPAKQPPLLVTSQPLAPKEVRAGIYVYAGALDDSAARAPVLPKKFRPNLRVDSAHLDHLARAGEEIPWHTAIYENIRDYFFPPKQPPLKLTSRPVRVKNIWGFSGDKTRYAELISFSVHAGVILFLFVAGASYVQQSEIKQSVTLINPVDIAPYMPKALPRPKQMGGGGGGGDRSPTPASKGRLPRLALKQFVPPAAVVNNPSPKLVMEPTIVVPPDVNLPKVNIMAWGDPLSKIGLPSNGPGSGSGIGSGSGGGVGSGKGAGFGPGEGGGIGNGVYRIGGGVTAPTLIYKVEPEYSEEARKAKFQGTVVLYVVVDEKGMPRDIKVVRALGLGLDEKAVEAVEKWRFRPGYLNGKAVAVAATIEVNFRLL